MLRAGSPDTRTGRDSWSAPRCTQGAYTISFDLNTSLDDGASSEIGQRETSGNPGMNN